ncbi:hypothetical protein HanHA300_Chr04g0133731 [Helianthus annuus]|nr:hypothetical protein HanHA300_Chr04g0133731 [Helianthus annuus]KAJ0757437.1 hypothetical protein HanLR1_Chr04g0138731 [Helianthus annuus]KAJ0761136.1 hypothetical protein HanOQP8_Chr04g0146261 [Helianthus annuus]
MHNYVFTSCSLFFQNSILRMITFSKLGNLLHMLNISYHFLTPWFLHIHSTIFYQQPVSTRWCNYVHKLVGKCFRHLKQSNNLLIIY